MFFVSYLNPRCVNFLLLSTELPPLALQDNVLFYGDNLDILRRFIPDESIDLIYLDPPFNSKADYNILFKESTGEESAAQIRAFTDFWHWDAAARQTHDYLVGNEVDNRVATVADSLYRLLGKNDMTAYLFMMTVRLVELRRVLKPTGSLYLHCDPTASHYLKLTLDSVFGERNFAGEIVWQRTNNRSTTGNWPSIHDTLLYYRKTAEAKFKTTKVPADTRKLPHTLVTGSNGKKYQTYELTAPGVTKEGESGRPWRGFDPSTMGRHWANDTETRDNWDAQGLIHWPKDGGFPRRRDAEPFDESSRKVTVGDVWTDIDRLNQTAKERLGYPTQKPTQLLERVIEASTDPDDWVLDPFCGCGTAIDAAEKLHRHWIGIDITYLAVNVIKRRMHEAYPRARFRIEGEPQELEAAQALAKDRYQFQWWALSLINARPVGSSTGSREGRKGADEGVDGWLRFNDANGRAERIVVQVKSGHVGVKDIRELRDVVSRQRAAMGIFITLEEPTSEMVKEERATEPFKHPTWHHEYPAIQILTVKDLLRGKVPDIPPTINPYQEAQVAKKRPEGRNETLSFGSLHTFETKRSGKGSGTQDRLA